MRIYDGSQHLRGQSWWKIRIFRQTVGFIIFFLLFFIKLIAFCRFCTEKFLCNVFFSHFLMRTVWIDIKHLKSRKHFGFKSFQSLLNEMKYRENSYKTYGAFMKFKTKFFWSWCWKNWKGVPMSCGFSKFLTPAAPKLRKIQLRWDVNSLHVDCLWFLCSIHLMFFISLVFYYSSCDLYRSCS